MAFPGLQHCTTRPAKVICARQEQVEMKEALAYLLIWGKDRFLIFKQELSVACALNIHQCRYIMFVDTSTEQPMAASHSPRSEIEDPRRQVRYKVPPASLNTEMSTFEKQSRFSSDQF